MKIRAFAAGAGLLLSAGMAVPAAAQTTICAGTTGTIYACTDPTGGTVASDCIYLGEPTCTPVTVPGPTLACRSALIPTLACRGF